MAIVSNPFGQRQPRDHKPKLNFGLGKAAWAKSEDIAKMRFLDATIQKFASQDLKCTNAGFVSNPFGQDD
jgi:hypothetical protein